MYMHMCMSCEYRGCQHPLACRARKHPGPDPDLDPNPAPENPNPTPRSQGQLLLPIGDALQEPFWPEGLGINRGIHNALDACWVAHKWGMACAEEAGSLSSPVQSSPVLPAASASGDATLRQDKGSSLRADLVAERQYLYRDFTAPLNGKNRADILRPESADAAYFADPDSRYVHFKDRGRPLHEYAQKARSVRQQRQRAQRDRERSRSPRR